MVYMGSKSRIAKYIIPILEMARINGQVYWEPFVGGCNMINKMTGARIGTDSNKYLIALYNGLKQGFEPKDFYTKEEYYDIMKFKDQKYDSAEVGYVGFCCSYSGKFFAGYAGIIKGNKLGEVRNKQKEMGNNLLSTFDPDILYICADYDKTFLDPYAGRDSKMLIYCDPPYQGTIGYKVGEI